jgi:hypothetical protein
MTTLSKKLDSFTIKIIFLTKFGLPSFLAMWSSNEAGEMFTLFSLTVWMTGCKDPVVERFETITKSAPRDSFMFCKEIKTTQIIKT